MNLKLIALLVLGIVLLSSAASAIVVYPGGTFKGDVDLYGYNVNNATNFEENITRMNASFDATLVNETAINDSISDLLGAAYVNETAINDSISDLLGAAYVNETAINDSISDLLGAAYVNETAINVSISDLQGVTDGINLTLDATLVNETAINVSISDLQVNDSTIGSIAVGAIKFGATADCESVTIGGRVYTYAATPNNALGEWGPYGANGAATATALAVAINGDNRNTGGPYFLATANTDTVHIYALTVGVPATPAISKFNGTDPVTIEALAGGAEPAYLDSTIVSHTVTALDVETLVLVNIPIPFAPSYYLAFITDSTGVSRPTVTDVFSIGTTPNRIILTDGGAVHVVATDIITIYAYE